MRYERQIVLREWGSAGQAAIERSCAALPCSGASLEVAVRYVQAAGVAEARACEGIAGPFAAAMGALPWHTEAPREVGLGAAHALDFLATTLREVGR